MDDRRDRYSGNRNGNRTGDSDSDFKGALNRLEDAVQDLVGSAKGEVSDRATEFVEEAAERLQREADARRRGSRRGGRNGNGGRHGGGQGGGNGGRRGPYRGGMYGEYHPWRGWNYSWPERSGRLLRDPDHAKIAGVCAGLANYFGVERWVVRCIALTSLIFLPSITFPAYWILYFMMDSPDEDGETAERKLKKRSHRRQRRDRSQDRHASPAPELGPQLSPRRSLRSVQADLNEIELKLRRMESHVTSGHYELQRELNKMEKQGS